MNCNCNILALHGFTGCGDDFMLLKSLCPDNFLWDRPDLHAPGIAHEIAGVCSFLSRRWDALAGTPRVLLGYSMGGRIALHLAQKIKFGTADKLILISASPGLESETERSARKKRDEALADKIDATTDAETFYAEWEKLPIISTQRNTPAPWRQRIVLSRKNSNHHAWADSLRDLGTGSLPSLWGSLKNVPAKTLLITGEYDIKFSNIAESMANLMPQATHTTVPACGHSPQFENATETAKLITQFLNS